MISGQIVGLDVSTDSFIIVLGPMYDNSTAPVLILALPMYLLV